MFPKLRMLDQASQDKIKSQRYKAHKEIKIMSLAPEMARGMAAAEDIIPYPPGIPLILTFEIIDDRAMELLKKFNYSKINCYEIKSL